MDEVQSVKVIVSLAILTYTYMHVTLICMFLPVSCL